MEFTVTSSERDAVLVVVASGTASPGGLATLLDRLGSRTPRPGDRMTLVLGPDLDCSELEPDDAYAMGSLLADLALGIGPDGGIAVVADRPDANDTATGCHLRCEIEIATALGEDAAAPIRVHASLAAAEEWLGSLCPGHGRRAERPYAPPAALTDLECDRCESTTADVYLLVCPPRADAGLYCDRCAEEGRLVSPVVYRAAPRAA